MAETAVPQKDGILTVPKRVATGYWGNNKSTAGVCNNPPPPAMASMKPAEKATRHNRRSSAVKMETFSRCEKNAIYTSSVSCIQIIPWECLYKKQNLLLLSNWHKLRRQAVQSFFYKRPTPCHSLQIHCWHVIF